MLFEIFTVMPDMIKHGNFLHLVNMFCYCQWVKLSVISCTLIFIVLSGFVTLEISTGRFSVKNAFYSIPSKSGPTRRNKNTWHKIERQLRAR